MQRITIILAAQLHVAVVGILFLCACPLCTAAEPATTSGRSVPDLVRLISEHRNPHTAGDSAKFPEFSDPQDRKLVGLNGCVRCHSLLPEELRPSSNENTTDRPILDGLSVQDDWILGNEFSTWRTYDKHAQAYAALKTELAQSMARILGVQDEQGESLIHNDVRCLACHSSVPVNAFQLDLPEPQQPDMGGYKPLLLADSSEGAPKAYAASNLIYGVSCEACHGPAGQLSTETGSAGGLLQQEGWERLHYAQENWRNLSSQERYSHGLWDTRSYVNRTKICASCHIGNAEQGKIITHEMYAAGHPPLPNLEIATFSNQQPYHWRGFFDKPAPLQEKFARSLSANVPSEEIAELNQVAEQSTIMLVSSLMSLAEQLRLVAAPSGSDEKYLLSQLHGRPEFANFACFNCHHDLRIGSWRQRRQPLLKPGRPNFHEWMFTSAELSASVLGRSEPYEIHLKSLIRNLNDVPFGDPEKDSAAYHEFADWLEQEAWKLSHTPLMVSELPQLMITICNAGKEQRDYDSFRQLVWSLVVVYDEWNLIQSGRSGDRPIHRYEESVEKPRFDGWYDNSPAAIGQVIKGIHDRQIVMLDLNQFRDRGARVPLTANGPSADPYQINMRKIFPMISAYESTELHKAFDEIERAIQIELRKRVDQD